MKKELDSNQLHMLSTQGIYIEPLWLKEHRERMRQIYQDCLDEMISIERGEIPTKYGFEIWRIMSRDKKRRDKVSKFRNFIKRLFNKLK